MKGTSGSGPSSTPPRPSRACPATPPPTPPAWSSPDRPVVDYVPLAKNDESVVTQYVMTTLEELGLLKMDFLGLRNLTILDDTVRLVQKSRPGFSLADIPDNDPAVFQMLSEGRTSGVFQMESAGMTGVCVGLKPQNIEDITAIIALYRPGPMDSIPRFIACKHNPDKVKYKHPMLEPILSVTYGCIVYQEQVIEIFRRLAGYTLGQADMVRRAMSKKKVKDIERERQAFVYGDAGRAIAGCIANGVPEDVAKDIYDEIYAFANYAFNKAHAVAYAIVCYQTAWFKCHYTKEYMAALLTSVLDSSEKVAEYIAECRDCGIHLLPPTSMSRRPTSPCPASTSASAWWPSREWAGALSTLCWLSGAGEGPLSPSLISASGCSTRS